jgi:molybdopterin synthase catalytic subunit
MNDAVVITGLLDELSAEALVGPIRRPECGGVAVFEGRTRSPSEGREVVRLEYEAYDELARSQLEEFAHEAVERFDLGGAVVVHRTGLVPIGEASVLVAASAVHRDQAFAGARWLIDRVKSEAAIWKKEIFVDGEAWVGVP